MFESAPQPNEPGGKLVNATDKRFFWLAVYCQPASWVALAVVAVVKFEFIWLTLVGKFDSVSERGRRGGDGGMGDIVGMFGGIIADWRFPTQPLPWFLPSRTPWHSRDATSSAKLVD